MQNERKREGVSFTHKSGPLNSTDFTNCCGLAVLPGDKSCPGCGNRVAFPGLPRSKNCRMCGQPRHVCYC